MSAAIAVPPVEVRLHASLAGAASPAWGEVAALGDTWTVFQEPAWLQCWWDSFGRGRLLVAEAVVAGRPVAIAPLFVDGDMAFFVGSGGSDYLDFIGDVGAPRVLEALLAAVADAVPGLLGFRFYHVPDASRTGLRLQHAAAGLGLACHDEGELAAPALDMGPGGERGLAAAAKTSLVRHERGFQREGGIEVRHLRHGEDILPWLDAFFAQHEARWDGSSSPSLFLDPAQRAFYRRLAAQGGEAGWLRFTVVGWQGSPIAFHFGFCHRGSFLWYKPSFDVALARRSPGEVLLRQLLLAAVDEGAHTFDFGLGDEAFKRRFTTGVRLVRTWGLYPKV